MELPFSSPRQIYIGDIGGQEDRDSSAAKPASRIRSGNLDQDGVSSRTEIFSDAVIQASMTALAALARFPSTQNTQQKIVGSLINDVKMGLTSHAETRSRITIG